MRNLLRRMFGHGSVSAPARGEPFQHWPAAIYAIGDIHGCIGQLRALEDRIVQDGQGIAGEKWVVWLGDLVDRGPNSAAVLDRALTRLPPGFTRHCIAGNHDAMMLEFLKNPDPKSDWLGFGGLETLYSYGMSSSVFKGAGARQLRDIVQSHVPSEHIHLLERMPSWISVPGTVLVHAGIRRGVPMDQQREADLLWIRDEFFEAPNTDRLLVVHGHTPVDAPVITPDRICLDTGCYASGVLTAARLQPQKPPHILAVEANRA